MKVINMGRVSSEGKSVADNSNKTIAMTYLLRIYGIGVKRNKIWPWFVFLFIASAGVWQLNRDFDRYKGTNACKVMYFVNFFNAFMSLFLTVRNRQIINQLADEVYSSLNASEINVIRKSQRTISMMVYSLVISLLFLCIYFHAWNLISYILYSSRINYIRIIMLIFKILRQLLVAFFVTNIYCISSLYLIFFIALTRTRINRIQQLKSLYPYERTNAMHLLIEMRDNFEKFQAKFGTVLFQIIISHFCEITIFFYRVYIKRSLTETVSSLILLAWTTANMSVVIFIIFKISDCQDQVKKAAGHLCDLISIENWSHINLSQLILMQKIKSIGDQCVTVMNIVQVDRSLVIGILSSFLGVAVLFVQMDNGSLQGATNVTDALSSLLE